MIITDDIEMKAIADHYGYDEAAIRGVNAGVDNFLCCHTAEVAHQLIATVAGAVENGGVALERLEDANRRVDSFTARWARPAEEPRFDVLACDAHLGIVEEILSRVDPVLADMGEDPTEIMERIRVERMRQKGLQP
jgi:beta-N-acetylhexosaminidase